MIEDNSFSMNTVAMLAQQRRFPYMATMELLTLCNYRCQHCYLPEHDHGGLQYGEIIDIFRQLREMGTISLVLTGGEIFLRKDILDIVRTARDMGFSVTLFSNASVLDERMILELANLHINAFSTTIFSLSEEVNDEITRTPNSLKPILHNIELMLQRKIRVEVKTPLTNLNKFAYRKLIPYCEERGIKYVPSTLITSKANGDTSNLGLRLNANDLECVFDEIDYLLQRSDLEKEPFDENALPCPEIRRSLYIDCRGDVYPCNSFYFKVGNVRENDISYIWEHSEGYKRLNSITNNNLKQCKSCEIKEFCTRCPGHALLEDGQLMGCSSLDRQYAVILHRRKQGELL